MDDRDHAGPDRAHGQPPALPHDDDAEAAVLGAALMSAEARDAARRHLGDASAFYRPSHGHIWTAICALADRDSPVDAVTTAAELRRTGLLDDAGGDFRLVELISTAPGVANAATYAQIVADAATLRRILGAVGSIAEQARAGPPDVAAFASQARQLLDGVTATAAGPGGSTLDIPDLAEVIAGGIEVEQAAHLKRNDGLGLLYAGKLNMLWGAPSVGKGWVALLAVAQVLDLDGSAVYVDWEDSVTGIVGRLLALGVVPAAITDRVRYVRPTGAFGAVERAELLDIIGDLNADLVILDGVAASMQREGLDEDRAPDFYQWLERCPRPIADTGAAVLALDHVRKDAEATERYGRGTGAKLAAVDGAAYHVRPSEPFSRKRAGSFRLVVSKDRPGGVGAIGETAAVIHVDPHADGEHVTLRITPPEEQRQGRGFQPTKAMAAVSDLLAEARKPVKQQAILDALGQLFKAGIIRSAVAALVHDGFAEEVTQGRSQLVRHVRPYPPPKAREAEPAELDEPPPGLFEDDVIDMNEWKDRNL